MCYERRALGGGLVQEISRFGSWLSAECAKGSDNKCMVLTIDQVGQVSKGSLYTKVHSQESEVKGM